MTDWLQTFGQYDPTLGLYLAANDKSLVVSSSLLKIILLHLSPCEGLYFVGGYFRWGSYLVPIG